MNSALLLLIMCAILVVVLFFIGLSIFMAYKKANRLRLRCKTNKGIFVKDYWMWEKKDKDTGSSYWKSVWFQKRIKCERPPDECVEVGKGGLFYAEAHLLNEGNKMGVVEVCWIRDKGINEFMNLDLNGKTIIDSFKPFDVTKKSFAIYEFKKAEEKRKHKLNMQEIMNYAFMTIIVFALIIGMIFVPDVMKQWGQIEKEKEQWLANANQITLNQALIMQSLGMKVGNVSVQLAQVPTSVPQNTISGSDEKQPTSWIEKII